MRKLLEQKLFPYVIKPGRYCGGESGQIIKDPRGRINYLHTYPDKYDIGQSYVGLQSLYHIINSDDRFLCERAFAVDTDAEEIMRRENIPLFSLETSRAAADFDAIGFTLPYELVYTNMLNMLDLSGIPLTANERNDKHPLIFAGGPMVFNPEPLAPFIDLFFIGDAEEGLPQILSILHDNKNLSRTEKLEQIVRNVKSVYVPAFYDEQKKPIVDFAPEKIESRLVLNLRPEFFPDQPIVPMIEIVHDHLAVEIMRGCPQGCRFCMAGPIYRPVRVRPQNEILDQIDRQSKNTGYSEVALMSLSSSDYPGIDTLATAAARRLEPSRAGITLPALRPGTIGPALLDAASKVRRSGLTIAPETGTERLRLFVRKEFSDQAIFDTARLAFSKGWTSLKLYFMIGLPTETDEDLDGILNIVRKIYQIGREYPGKTAINVSLSPFAPKPHTPFQWDAQATPSEVLRKVQYIKRGNRINQVNFKYTSIESTLIQGVLGRGGREMSAVILSAYNKGCRFDGWSEHFKPELWLKSFEEEQIDIESKLNPIPFSADLPWSHISKGVSTEHLQKERHRTSTALKESIVLPPVEEEVTSVTPSIEYGRGKKKVATRNTGAPTKNRLRVHWGKTARYRFMSHLDNLRMIERMIRRCAFPVAYSQGFNPTMKLSFGPPLPLGFTSQTELVDIILDRNLSQYMVDDLKQMFPEGFDFIDARPAVAKKKSLSALINRTKYTVPIDHFDITTAALEKNIAATLEATSIIVERQSKSGPKTVDIRPGVYEVRAENGLLEMNLGLGEGRFVRPLELINYLLGNDPSIILPIIIHRERLFRVDENGVETDGMDL